MAWEARKGTESRYYYRAVRQDDRVVKVGYGSGHRAALMARLDAEARAARQRDEAAAQALEAELEPLERLSVEMDEQVDSIMQAVLLASGFHRRRGQWRSRHGSRHNADTAHGEDCQPHQGQ